MISGVFSLQVMVTGQTVLSVMRGMGGIDQAYHMNHQGGETVPRPVLGGCHRGRNPYPCEFDRGIIEALVQQFKPFSACAARCVQVLPVEARRFLHLPDFLVSGRRPGGTMPG